MQDEKQESIATSPEKKELSGAVRSAETARVLVRRAKRAARRKFAAEEKVRIVMEGIRGELRVAELCRREGIPPTIYYISNDAGRVKKFLVRFFLPPATLMH
jgi:hypothetical protein